MGTGFLLFFVSQVLALGVRNTINTEMAQRMVCDFLTMEEGDQKSGLRQELCSYVIRQVCSPESNAEQDTVVQIFLDALKAYTDQFQRELSGDFSVLPDEVLFHMMSFGNPMDWRVCKGLDRITRDPMFAQAPMVRIRSSEGLQKYIENKKYQARKVKIDYSISDAELSQLGSSDSKVVELDLSGSKKITDAGILALSNLDKLNSLDLSNAGLGNSCFQYLPKRLISLRIAKVRTDSAFFNEEGKNITDNGLSVIASQCPDLEELCLDCSCSLYGMVSGVGLEHLSKLERLTKLDLYNTNFRNSGIRHLPKNLSYLSVMDQRGLTDDDLSAIASQCPNLEELSLGCYKVTSVGLKHLSELGKLTKLKLENIKFDDSQMQYLPKSLTSFGLDGSRGLTNNDLSAIVSRYPNLEELCLNHCDVTSGGFQQLSKLERLTKLKLGGSEFGNSNIDFGDSNIQCLAKSLTSLSLDGPGGLTNNGLSAIVSRCPDLRTLHLSSNSNITNTGLEHLSGLKELTRLELAGTRVSDDGLQYVPRSLVTLKLAGEITGAGFQNLPESLTELDLRGCYGITDTGLQHLSEKCPNLTTLWLECHGITPAGLNYLNQCRRPVNRNIRVLESR